MPAFGSPLSNPAAWEYEAEQVVVPAGLRYGGYRLTAIRAASGGVARPVVSPADGALRSLDVDGQRWFELQPSPFAIRPVVTALAMGLPTFYLVLAAVATPGPPPDTHVALGDELAPGPFVVRIAVAGQDRVRRDPALWATEILRALGAGDPSAWAPFAAAVTAALAPPDREPLVLYTHTGDTLEGPVELVDGTGNVVALSLLERDLGDVTAAMTRLGMRSPWALPAPVRVRRAEGSTWQAAALEDDTFASSLLTITRERRHIAFTDLAAWFAPQLATLPAGVDTPARFHRGNRIRFHLDGKPFFDEWFRLLGTADVTNGGVHLAGWAMFNELLAQRRPGDPPLLPRDLEAMLERVIGAGGAGRFLATQFFQLDPTAPIVPVALAALLGLTFLVLALSPGTGNEQTAIAGVGAALGAMFYGLATLENNADSLEPNADTRNRLNRIAPGSVVLAPLPSIVADNPRGVAALAGSGPGARWMLDNVLRLTNRLSVYHQKFSVIRINTADGARHIAYAGGIDFVPQQLDDIHHLAAVPFHDVQARIEGPAVRDLALTFEQRWQRDGGSTPLAFPTPTAEALRVEQLPAGPACAMQVARTYFAADPATPMPPRALAFAPAGDRTLLDTVLAALANAREHIFLEDQYLTPPPEYTNAIIAALPRIKQLVITVPAQTDVPFGDQARSAFVRTLTEAARDTRTPVRIGYPRRRIMLAGTTRAAGAGRLWLADDLPETPSPSDVMRLTPASRVPAAPFWAMCGGELVWAYRETTASSPTADERAFLVHRGPTDTRFGAGPYPTTRRHVKDAPVTVVDVAGIYVHCKLLIVDDVFLSHGSANTNRRGFYSDGELNVFTIPEALRMSSGNPIAALRRRIWAELFDLPADLAGPLVDDPVGSLAYFDRPSLLGNRYTNLDHWPEKLTWSAGFGDSAVALALQTALFGITSGFDEQINAIAGDPSNLLERP